MKDNNQNRSTVMLALGRKVIANLFVEAIEKRPNMEAFAECNYESAKAAAMTRKPDIALVEIPERNGTPALDMLKVCEEIKEASPGCKIMLLCPETDRESVAVCVEARQHERIEDFLFYDASTDYLASKIQAMN